MGVPDASRVLVSGGQRPVVAHLTSVHDAHDVRILHKECRSLAEAGYPVVLIAPHAGDETVDGVRIQAVAPPRSRWERLTRTSPAVFRAALRSGAQVVHLHDPELLPWGLLLKLMGRRVIYDAHENLPKDIRTKHYVPSWLRAGMSVAADAVERAFCAAFDGVVTVTPGIAARFPAERTALVRNYPRLEELETVDAPPYAARRPVALYLGGLSAIRGTREMVEAIGRVEGGLGAELWLAGRFDPPRLEAELASDPGWARTVRLGWQTRAQVMDLLHQARVGLLVLHPAPNHLDSLPIKLFEYMAAGLPVVASDFPAWRQILGEGGMYVDPLDAEAIARAVQWLLSHPTDAEAMGKIGHSAVSRTLHWEQEAAALKQLYARVAGPPPRGEP
jgi:glycosyltransferase involved in cell wall biosynthesis